MSDPRNPLDSGGAAELPTAGEGCLRRYDPEALSDQHGTHFPGAAELWQQLSAGPTQEPQMSQPQRLILGAGANGEPVSQSFRVCNRHGLIAGATGTGKTVTLQRLVEAFSDAGVAVFAADIKGDLCGLGAVGAPSGGVAKRIESMPWLGHQPRAYPVTLWDVDGRGGHPLRTTLSEMGPLLLSNLLELTDSQQAALQAVFKVADREGLLLLDLKDLKALVGYLLETPKALGEDAALFTKPSAQALLRKLSGLEQQGAEAFFGEPALQLADILRGEPDGRGRIHLLDARRLVHEAPRIYATFLLWLLAELFEQLPERGDADKPLLALFFDEAHLLFDGTPKALQDRLEQVVRLIRSKGVGVFFVTQSPSDLPDPVLAQLGLRIQHGLRAFTAREQKALRAVAEGFRPNPEINALKELTELGIGEALVGTLDEKGIPEPVQRVAIAPPQSRIGPLSDAERAELIRVSPLGAQYAQAFDRDSAYEMLGRRAVEAARQAAQESAPAAKGQAPKAPAPRSEAPKPRSTSSRTSRSSSDSSVLGNLASKTIQSVVRNVANQIGRELVRGLLGSLTGKKR